MPCPPTPRIPSSPSLGRAGLRRRLSPLVRPLIVGGSAITWSIDPSGMARNTSRQSPTCSAQLTPWISHRPDAPASPARTASGSCPCAICDLLLESRRHPHDDREYSRPWRASSRVSPPPSDPASSTRQPTCRASSSVPNPQATNRRNARFFGSLFFVLAASFASFASFRGFLAGFGLGAPFSALVASLHHLILFAHGLLDPTPPRCTRPSPVATDSRDNDCAIFVPGHDSAVMPPPCSGIALRPRPQRPRSPGSSAGIAARTSLAPLRAQRRAG